MAEGKQKPQSNESRKHGCCFYLLFTANIIVVILAVAVTMMPDVVHPIAYTMPEPISLTGPLAPNEKLQTAVKVATSMKGPESIAFHGEHMFAGTVDGKIMKVNRAGKAVVLAELGNCSSVRSCGRPLGMRMDPTNKFLVVVDAFLGVFRVDPATGKHKKLFPVKDDFNVTFLNDLDFLSKDEIVLTETSSLYYLDEIMKDIFESAGNGRLLLVNLKTGRHEVIRDGLVFPNGVQRDLKDSKRESVLVVETTRDRIQRVFVKGPRRGQMELFANLPGMPDNIRAAEAEDGYWVGLAAVRSQTHDSRVHMFSQLPAVRGLLAKLIKTPASLLSLLAGKYGMILKLNLNGGYAASLHDTNGSVVPSVAEVIERKGALYLSNYNSQGIAVVDQGCKAKKNCFFQKV